MRVPNRSGRERFRVAVFSVLGVHLAFLLLLLAQGYSSDATTITIPAGEPADSPASVAERTMAAEQKPVPRSAGSPNLTSASLVPTGEAGIAIPGPDSADAAAIPAETIHVVKAGETLSRISRLYQTTIKSLKVANGLKDERLSIGMKLRIPNSRLLATAH